MSLDMPIQMSVFLRRLALPLALVSLLTGCGGGVNNTGQFSPATRAALDNAVTAALTEGQIPGAVAGFWIPGQGSYVNAVGVSDKNARVPIAANYHFRIGSVTKTFSITLLLILAGEGKLKLDDPVSKYLDFVPNGQNVTLRELANMTSGLSSYSLSESFYKQYLADPNRVWTPRELVNIGLALPPQFPPGTGWDYSNTNTVLLGMIMEKVTGKTIPTLFQERIFTPLGLKNTYWPTDATLPAPFSHGYSDQTADGTVKDVTFQNMSWAFTAGQLISTVDDLHIWARALGRGTLLTPEMQKERLIWVTFPPNTPTRKYGLGIGVSNNWLGHSGELPGYNTNVYYLPEKDASVVVLTNTDVAVGTDQPATRVFRAMAKVVTPDNIP